MTYLNCNKAMLHLPEFMPVFPFYNFKIGIASRVAF